jgi:L-cysteine:1D-myo-inositol 2-amino-2-deoxy-alpha-D-glucopyranoside ligase
MQLFNSASGQKERFRPRPGKAVTIYVCGVTPYDTTHLGHAFTYHTFDVLARHMSTAHRWRVRMAQNVTDIDDDILRKATETGEDWRTLGDRWTAVFRADLGKLNLRAPDVFPGATAHIQEIQEVAAALIECDLAYVSEGSVYFRVAADPNFGALVGWSYERMLAVANERGNHPADPNKEDPLDFVLWQRGVPGEPAWNSPWGLGRPGWHIECSTLADLHLGSPVDIHGGGGDLVFPHHACEIAQAEPTTGARPWVRCWMHVAMVGMDGEKMSKSLGNLVLVRDLLVDHEPDTIRLYLLRHHYRQAWSWDEQRFHDVVAHTRVLHAAVRRASGEGRELPYGSYGPRVVAALDDDLDTPKALEVILGLADDILEAPANADVRGAQDVLRATASGLLGLWLRPLAEVPTDERAPWPPPTFGDPDRDGPASGPEPDATTR